MGEKLTTEDFIKKSKEKHGDKYIYDKVNYLGTKKKVIITCKLHGEFEQEPYHHKNGCGCPICGNTVKYTNNNFIEKSVKVHGELYDYSKVLYINNNSKVKIICKIHGEFEQNPTSHFNGYGCAKCSGLKMDTKDFIKKSVNIHGNKYDYSNVIYINSKTKVIINCKKHGDFIQAPPKHLSGQGCPVCNKSKGENKIENILIENNINYKPQFSFPDLKYKSSLYFDFAILDKNSDIKYLIEYNGEQHYNFKNQFNMTKEQFIEGLERDKLKQNYCFNHNIPLYIIKYDEPIDLKLKEIISLY